MTDPSEVLERVRELILAEHGVELTDAQLGYIQDLAGCFDEVESEDALRVCAKETWTWFGALQGAFGSSTENSADARRKIGEGPRAHYLAVPTPEASQPEPGSTDPPGASELRMRAEAYTAGLSAIASMHPKVRHFRSAYLGDQLLTSDQVYQFLRSPALRLFPLEELEAAGVPILDHRAEAVVGTVQRHPVGKISARFEMEVRVTPPGVVLKSEYIVHKEAYEREGRVVRWKSSHEDVLHWYTAEGVRKNSFPIAPNSVISELRDVASTLERCLSWQQQQAIVFILTGAPAWVSPVTARAKTQGVSLDKQHFVWGQVQLQLAPWVPPDYVAGVFERSRNKLVYSRRQRDRPLGEKATKVFVFVVERLPSLMLDEQPTRHPITWNELREQWDAANPELAFGPKGTSGFWRAFTRTRDLIFPNVGPVFDGFKVEVAKQGDIE